MLAATIRCARAIEFIAYMVPTKENNDVASVSGLQQSLEAFVRENDRLRVQNLTLSEGNRCKQEGVLCNLAEYVSNIRHTSKLIGPGFGQA